MKMSTLFTRTDKTAKEYDTINATLLTKAGFVNQLMAGVYTILPLGLRVLRKIEDVIREEMDAIGGQEIKMPALHPSENWKQTGAWDGVDVLFKIKSRTEKDYALGQSEEEVVTPLLKEYVNSYKDMPVAVYQIQNKYRDELRAKSGILRGREFGMKDMYSFHETPEDFLKFYEEVKGAYKKIFERLGLTAKVTEASGGSFSKKISYEFMVLTDAGEDDILYCDKCDFCINQEIAGDLAECKKCGAKLQKAKAAEVGNVFDLAQKYPKDFEFSFTDASGEEKYPFMGCYGIGTTRAMGVIVEKFHDENGIIWPENVAPFQVHLISLGEDEEVKNESESLYKDLMEKGVEVLWDDRDTSAGEKFTDADLIGNPIRLVISKRSLESGGYEVKQRNETESKIMQQQELFDKLIRS
ncbi:hypothetical protein JW978_03950 [Candidatus Dojkabacteria bacterium]|nr:hypothetical protein [Candidatus Dojkabacteria bacterium]